MSEREIFKISRRRGTKGEDESSHGGYSSNLNSAVQAMNTSGYKLRSGRRLVRVQRRGPEYISENNK